MREPTFQRTHSRLVFFIGIWRKYRKMGGTELYKLKILALCGAMLAAGLAPTLAQDNYPSRTIRLVAGFPPGGGLDTIGRLFADKLSVILGQQVVVLNQAGAAGGIAGKRVSTEDPDGYTVLLASNSMVIYSLMHSKAGLLVERDLYPVVSVAPQAVIITTTPTTKANTLKELMELSKTNRLNYGTPGAGSVPHLVIEQLISAVPGVQMQHVPFQGAAPALTATMSNQIDFASTTLPPAVSLVTGDKVKGIAVTTPARVAALPNIPTTKESGFPDNVVTVWNGFFVPPKTPKAIVDKLEAAILQVAAMPDIKEKLVNIGYEPTAEPGAKFREELSAEIKRWSAVLERIDLLK